MNSLRKKLIIFFLASLTVILGSVVLLYLLDKEQGSLKQVGNNLNKNIYLATTTIYYDNQNSTTQQEDSFSNNGGVYRNTIYNYEIQYPKGAKIGSVTEEFLPINELVAVRFSFSDRNATLDIFGGLWETMIPMTGMGININTLYSDDLKTFAQKIWELQGRDFDHKAIESVTDLVKVPFAGTQAYSFIARTKGASYIKYSVGNGDTEKNFLIFEHLGKKIVVVYSSNNTTIETIKNSFKLVNE